MTITPKVAIDEVCCDMIEYLNIPVAPIAGPAGGNNVTIINASNSRVRKPEPTDSKFIRTLLTVQMTLETLAMTLETIAKPFFKAIPFVLGPLNFFKHARALEKAKEFQKNAEYKEPKTTADRITVRIVDRYTGIVGHNRSKAAQLIASATAFTASAIAHEKLNPTLANLSTKIISFLKSTFLPWAKKSTEVAVQATSEAVQSPEKILGAKIARRVMFASLIFGLLSIFWHEVRKPIIGPQYYQDIINRSGLAQRPGSISDQKKDG